MAGRWDTIEADGKMRCYVTIPAGGGPSAAVVVIQHAGGVDQFIQTLTDRIAEAGFVGIAPDLYHRDDPDAGDDALTRMSHLRDNNIVVDVNAAVEHVKTLPEASGAKIGITGFCMGGRVAYLLPAHNQQFAASVVFYGGNTMTSWGEGPTPFDLSDRIGCPVLGLFGADDGNPSPEDVSKLDAELTRLGKEHEFHSYQGAGHAFMNEGRPSYREDAAGDAWPKCIAWFERHLK